MGLTTQYHKYKPGGIFSLVASAKANVTWLTYNGTKGRYCAVGACENVIVWDTKTKEQVAVLYGEEYEVCQICASPNGEHLAVGYFNGSISLFDLSSGEQLVHLSGHKTAITSLAFDGEGMILASGSKDTDIIIWDTVSQSGLYRLKGHKGLVSELLFMSTQNILISSSKDTFIKFWDLDTQHCFRTLLSHKTEVYAMALNKEETRLYTGSADNEIRIFNLKPISKETGEDGADTTPVPKKPKKAKSLGEGAENTDSEEDGYEEEDFDEEERLLSCQYVGSLIRYGRGRTVSLDVDSAGRTLLTHGIDRVLESFLILNEEEITLLQKKRASKTRKRQRAAGEDDSATKADTIELTTEDTHKRHEIIRLPAKIAAIDAVLNGAAAAGVCQFAAVLSNNSLYTACIDLAERKSEANTVRHLCSSGHRTDVRGLAFSSDGSAIVSTSADEVKIWNRDSLKCIHTMPCGYALCCAFLPGDRYVVVGTKAGQLQLFDIASGTMLEEIEAHTAALWSLCVLPDKRGIVTGSADKSVKFWQFELIADEDESTDGEDEEGHKQNGEVRTTQKPAQPASKRLTLVPTRVLQMSDDVLCVKVSADSRLLAVSLLDNTIKVFFNDTLKFFLSLYGHSLPALSIDISTDGTILVSGSADKNVKIWGLDYGDCHKSLFAHDDSVMGVSFLPKTHLFMSCGKDGAVKQWDADTFNYITALKPAHHGEVWSIASSPSGMTVVSSSHDKSLRLWEKTEEVLVLEEEREMEREKQYDKDVEMQENPVVPGETNEEVGFASKKTVESVKSTERIMEAIDLWRNEKDKHITSDADIHPMLRAFNCETPNDYVLVVLQKVKPSELEESLLVMPFDYATDLLEVLDSLLRKQKSVELTSKCLLFLMKIHHHQIVANQMLLPTLDKLRLSSTSTVEVYKDRIGFNMAALQLLRLRLEDRDADQLFTDATSRFKKKEKRRKNKHKSDALV